MPTRFKYAKVQPQAYALTPAEILLATDAELNEYMGIKKYAPYRKDGSNWYPNRGARLRDLKTKITERRKIFQGGPDVSASAPAGGRDKSVKKRMGKKERMRAKAVADDQTEDAFVGEQEERVATVEEARNKRKRSADAVEGSTTAEVEEGGLQNQSKKRKRRHKKSGDARNS